MDNTFYYAHDGQRGLITFDRDQMEEFAMGEDIIEYLRISNWGVMKTIMGKHLSDEQIDELYEKRFVYFTPVY
jgi:hypothetical protein